MTAGLCLRRRPADVLDAPQRIRGVRAAKDARSKNYRQGISRHAVRLLFQGDPERIKLEHLVPHLF